LFEITQRGERIARMVLLLAALWIVPGCGEQAGRARSPTWLTKPGDGPAAPIAPPRILPRADTKEERAILVKVTMNAPDIGRMDLAMPRSAMQQVKIDYYLKAIEEHPFLEGDLQPMIEGLESLRERWAASDRAWAAREKERKERENPARE
jgi:hypothetical protein